MASVSPSRRARLRALPVVALSVLSLLALAGPAAAHPLSSLDPTLPTDLTFAATDNISYLGRFPEHTGTAGGRLSDDGTRFFLTDPRGVYVYDTTTPESPVLLDSLQLFQTTTGAALSQEDVDTNGEILLVDGSSNPVTGSRLTIVDVSDPEGAGLSVLGSIGVTDHTWTCVSGTVDGELNTCAYAYGRSGHIIDLTDPANPVNLDQTWRSAVGYGARSNSPYTHDLTEIRPGLVMSAGSTAILMDTTDPTRPVELTRITQPNRFSSLGYHSVEWSTAGGELADTIVLGTEIAPTPAPGLPAIAENTGGSNCKGENSVIETWDASAVVAELEAREVGETGPLDASFTRVDAYDAGGRGIYLEGAAPAHVLYCAHWMDLHGDYSSDGGLMAVSYYDRGTRFIEVNEVGAMQEIGWIVAAESYSGSARWISEDVAYVMDYRRGMEVVKIDTGRTAGGTYDSAGTLVALTSSYTPPASFHSESLVVPSILSLVLAMAWTERRRRQTAGA